MPVSRAAKVVIFDAKGMVLLLRRSNTHPHHALHPDLPGGIIEDNEKWEEGICRETKEETGFVVKPDSLRLVYELNHTYFGKQISRRIYVARLSQVRPNVQISWEHDKASWIELDSLQGLEEPYQKGIDYVTSRDLWDES
jgi:8-oxo-dGTP pyrophosphatase MutT (NUDIX family)